MFPMSGGQQKSFGSSFNQAPQGSYLQGKTGGTGYQSSGGGGNMAPQSQMQQPSIAPSNPPGTMGGGMARSNQMPGNWNPAPMQQSMPSQNMGQPTLMKAEMPGRAAIAPSVMPTAENNYSLGPSYSDWKTHMNSNLPVQNNQIQDNANQISRGIWNPTRNRPIEYNGNPVNMDMSRKMDMPQARF